MKSKFFLLILLISMTIMLASCGPSQVTLPTQKPEFTSSKPSHSVDESPTQFIRPTNTSTQIPDLSRLSFDCVEVKDSSQSIKEFDGVLVLRSLPSTLLNLKTHEAIELESSNSTISDISSLIVSPDGSMLAITYWDENVVTLMDSSGNMVDQVLISDSQNLNAKYWLDATHIVLMDWESTITNPYPSIIVDINEHSWIVFSPEFEDINRNPDGNGYSWYPTGGLTRLSINPQQTYLVYPSYKYTETLSELVLWDLEKKRDIARLQIDVSNTFPWWSPDGTRFITGGFWWSKEQNSELPDVGGLELVSVNVDGEIKRLSYYTTKYTAYTYDYIWSPDGQKIAFWMDILDPNNSRSRSYHGPYELATLDINTGEVINYCIRGLDYPVWSPDGQQLAIRASIIDNPAYEDVRDVYIVDLEEKIAVRSTDSGHQTVTGWMVYDP